MSDSDFSKSTLPAPDNSGESWWLYAVILSTLAVAGWSATAVHLFTAKQNRSDVESAVVVVHYHETLPFDPGQSRNPEWPVLRHGGRNFYLPADGARVDFPRADMVPIGRDSRDRYFLFEHRDSAEGIGPNGEIILFVRDAESRFIRVQTNPEEIE